MPLFDSNSNAENIEQIVAPYKQRYNKIIKTA